MAATERALSLVTIYVINLFVFEGISDGGYLLESN
jgi:hypothetical protein